MFIDRGEGVGSDIHYCSGTLVLKRVGKVDEHVCRDGCVEQQCDSSD